LLAEIGSCAAVELGAMVVASIWVLSSNILGLSCGVSGNVAPTGWIAPKDPLAPGMILEPNDIHVPGVVFAPSWTIVLRGMLAPPYYSRPP
jgi:hypothetical protein